MKQKTIHTILKSIIVVSTMMLFSCKNDIKNVVKISEIEKVPELLGEDIFFTQSENGSLVLQVYTKKLQKFSKQENPTTVFPKGIEVIHFYEYPDTQSMISADYAILHENKELWEAKGNVYARNTKGEVLNTEYLAWDQQNRTISSDQQVQITTQEDIIYGQGFHSDEQFDNWEIDKVTGIFTFDSLATDSLKVGADSLKTEE